MKFLPIFVILMSILSLFVVPNEARPGKIPINAIKKGAKVVVSIAYLYTKATY